MHYVFNEVLIYNLSTVQRRRIVAKPNQEIAANLHLSYHKSENQAEKSHTGTEAVYQGNNSKSIIATLARPRDS